MLTGTENTLSALIKTEIEARILASTGNPVASPNAIQEFTDSVAFAIIPHLVSNTQVAPGSFTTSAGPVTGVGALL